MDGVATIPFSQVEDGHLHRFAYTAADGTEMRFIIILKNGGAYGVGLDACETCGDAGYYEQDGKIICKRCDVAINLATIGFKGGCNPIPFPYQVDDGCHHHPRPPTLMRCPRTSNNERRFRCSSCA